MRDRDATGARRGRGVPIIASLAACLALPAAAGADTQTFNYTGAAQNFTVPAGVTELTVDAYGGAGGNSATGTTPDGGLGGLGGRATATIPVIPGEALEVNVGGGGADGTPGSSAGGFNGGGDVSGCLGADNAGTGGGASDLRRDTDGAGGCELDERLVVAGGGGGGDNSDATGGSGGGASGGPGGGGGVPGTGTPAGGGTQSGGGAAGTANGGNNGQPGEFGAGGDSPLCAGGAGGGGLWGGGSGARGPGFDGGGGGGSGFTPDGAGMTNGVRSGNGQVVLTYTVPSPPDGTTPPPDGTTPPAPSEFARSLGIAYSEKKDKFKGKLASQSPACASGQRVKVFEKEKGKDPQLGSDATDQKGKYSLKEQNAEGKFYAQVKQRGVPGGTCLAARSKTIKVD